MVAGRKRYIERRHVFGLKAPGGRPRSVARLLTLQQEASTLLRAEAVRIEGWLRDPAAVARLDDRLRQIAADKAGEAGPGPKS